MAKSKKPSSLAAIRRMMASMFDTSPGSSGPMSGNIQSRDFEIDQILNGLSGLGTVGGRPPVPANTRPPIPTDPVLRQSESLKDLASMFPRSISRMPFRTGTSYQFESLLSDGTITGSYHLGSNDFRVYVRSAGSRPPAGCNCEDSNGEFPCEHVYHFIQFLINHLKDSKSNFTETLKRKGAGVGVFKKADFKFDESQRLIRAMDLLLERAPVQEPSTEFTLPTSSNDVDTRRLAWCVELQRSVSIYPMIQQVRKRGGGWTKGRKVDMAELFSDSTPLTEADLRIRSKVRMNPGSGYYGSSYLYDIGEILYELIGQSHVYLDGEPVEVKAFDGLLEIFKGKEGFDFSFSQIEPDSVIAIDSHHVICVNARLMKVEIYKGSKTQVEFIKSMHGLSSVPHHREKEFLERALKLQSVVNLQLPTELAGPIQPETTRPLIVLRSRKDGALYYGIRVRDADDRLVKPAEGVMIRSALEEGRPIQLVRSLTDERVHSQDLLKRLELDDGKVDGTLMEFGQAIDLIEKLQTQEPKIEVLWDKTSEPPIHVLGTVSSQNVRVGITQKRDWFNLTGSCTIGDKEFDIVSLMDSLRAEAEGTRYGDYVKIKDGGWAKISDQLRKSLMQIRDSVNQERGSLRFDRTSAIAMREAEQHLQIQSTRAWQECLAKLSRSEKLEPVLPESLNATLRDYQIDGYKWLRRLAEWGVGGILADDMGLGKTVQTLAAVIDRGEEGPALVIAPTSVCFNWMREVEKFAPSMTAFMYRETDRAEFLTSVGNNQIVVCSYGLALRDAEHLAKVNWGTMVLDEAQAIKNSRSKTSMAIATIPSKWTVALTGTPVENHLGELWSLFRVVAPGVFGGWDQFRTRFAGPIERDNDDERRGALRQRLQPFVLRRTKKEVLKDLPARTEMNLYVELSAAERALYDEVRLSAIGEADAITKLPDIQDQRFKILALLTRLRQISCHPRLVHDSWKEGSAKLTQLTETLLQLREEGHRVLIFSQFVTHLQLIREMLDKESITYQYLDGSTPAAARQGQVDQFQNGDATAFLISLKAGGTGLNLTAADYVIHMDPWWNPAVEDQATDRAHRIGQQKPVMVYRIVAQNTIEEEILRLHDTKRDLVAGVLDGTHSAGKLSTTDLLALLRA